MAGESITSENVPAESGREQLGGAANTVLTLHGGTGGWPLVLVTVGVFCGLALLSSCSIGRYTGYLKRKLVDGPHGQKKPVSGGTLHG